MTQEEKAKAYDDAIKRAKRMFSEKELNYLFPELAESDDEKIISAIRKAIEAKVENLGNGVTRTACLAWLEKQGELVEINPSEFDSQLNKLLKQFETLPKEELINSLNFYLNVVQNNGTYKEKKQCEKPQGKSAVDAINEEKVDNQNCVKPSVKGEPKFKVDDYVVDNCGYVWRIEGIINQFYILEGIDGGESRPTIEWVNKTFHLWTIQDAKDGDVLAAHECLVLFREVDGLNIRCYCTYHFMNNPSFYVYTLQNKNAFHPASKEQRDKFEKAMAESGYEFDFDKKELKKIENEEYDGEDYGIDSLWHAKNILEKTLGKVDGYQTDDGILDHKCAISAVNKLCKEDAKITNRWNPSDEHIHWLKWVINRMPDTEKANEAEMVLKDLLEQLEEL